MSLRERSVQRVVQEARLRHRVVIVGSHQREALRDGAQPGRLRRRTDLRGEVRAVHDARELLEGTVVRTMLLCERLERAAVLAVVVRVARTRSVEADRAFARLHGGDFAWFD